MSELSPEARSLIEGAALADAPSTHDRERLRNKLALELGSAAFVATAAGVATTTTASAVASSASSTVASSAGAASTTTLASTGGGGLLAVASKLAVAATVVGAVGTTALVSLRPSHMPSKSNAQPAAQHAAPVSASSPATTPVVEPIEAPVVEPLLAPPTNDAVDVRHAPLRSVARMQKAPRATAAAASPTNAAPEPVEANALRDELELLTRAQTALREGRARDALELVHEHARRFAQGAMREERMGLEALAQCALGTGGAQVVRDFLELSPASPLARRVREACHVE